MNWVNQHQVESPGYTIVTIYGLNIPGEATFGGCIFRGDSNVMDATSTIKIICEPHGLQCCEAIFTNWGKSSIWHNRLMNIVDFAKFMNLPGFMNLIFL